MTTGTRMRLVLAVSSAFIVGGCSSPSSSSSPRAEVTVPSPAAPTSGSVAAKAPDLSKPQTIVTGLEVPWGLAFLPDGTALVGERNRGDIFQIPVGGGQPKRVYHIDESRSGGEGGLLGLAVDPQYRQNKYVYAYYTAEDENKIARFRLSDDTPTVIFDGITRGPRHNGGRLAFGPDGMLYVGTGDASEGEQSQNPTDVNGKILRLTRDGKPAPGNPTAGSPIWSMGHRNVQGLAWSADGTMYGIEFGQDTWDEVNIIEPGKNYGWPVVEGKGDNPKYADPIVQWRTDDASPSGAAIIGNTLYVAALKGQRLWTVALGTHSPKAFLTGKYGRLRTVGAAPDGALWVLTSNRDGRGHPVDSDDRILRFAPAA
ncbi:PQQ-dependent sugar dehydrogenase [Paractinoplanes globisporus]|uniref:PQQ-dependent sugar dehydrogenase n=1 Tax=Paractinoplanes globisporus TaxID=113565 RepID=A0ABW6WNE3_9ACTN|nr:PQQ-dependent sugar dehydrogenase [Actinoplanes globisporus]